MKVLARAAIVGIVASLCAPTAAGAAERLQGFSAVANASGGYAEYGIRGFLIVEKYIDGGGPTSKAYLDSLETSRSFASMPYPGETFVKYPGLVAFVTGQVPPGYPFYAGADYPNSPEAAVGSPDGPVSLTATAAADRSHGVARAGRGGNDATTFLSQAETEVARDGATVTATAASVTHGIAVGPLSIAAVTSRSLTKLTGGGEPTTTTELSVEGGRAGDMAFTYGPDGFRVTNNGLPVPAGDGLKALNSALEPSGIAVNVVSARDADDGQAAAVLEIVSEADVPGAGPGTLRLGFGGASSSISLGDSGAEDTATTPPIAEPPTSGDATPTVRLGAVHLAAAERSRRLGELEPASGLSLLAVVVAGLGVLGLAGSAIGVTRVRRTK